MSTPSAHDGEHAPARRIHGCRSTPSSSGQESLLAAAASTVRSTAPPDRSCWKHALPRRQTARGGAGEPASAPASTSSIPEGRWARRHERGAGTAGACPQFARGARRSASVVAFPSSSTVSTAIRSRLPQRRGRRRAKAGNGRRSASVWMLAGRISRYDTMLSALAGHAMRIEVDDLRANGVQAMPRAYEEMTSSRPRKRDALD